jgi:hypothetical protein
VEPSEIFISFLICFTLGMIIYGYYPESKIYTLTCDGKVVVEYHKRLVQREGVIRSWDNSDFSYRMVPGEVCFITRRDK